MPLDVSKWRFLSFFTLIICCIFLHRSNVMPFCKPTWKNKRKRFTSIVQLSSKTYVLWRKFIILSIVILILPFSSVPPLSRSFCWGGGTQVLFKIVLAYEGIRKFCRRKPFLKPFHWRCQDHHKMIAIAWFLFFFYYNIVMR